MFIETKEGSPWINSTEISAIQHRDQDTVTVVLRNGDTAVLDQVMMPLVAQSLCQLLPAQPGYEVLTAHNVCEPDGTSELQVIRRPVVGWRIGIYGPRPIPIEMIDCEVEVEGVVKGPDGRIFIYGGYFINEAEWLEHEKAQLKKPAAGRPELVK